MSTPSDFADVLRRILLRPTGGIVGLVDELLAVCGGYTLHFDWQASQCRVRCSDVDGEQSFAVPLRQSVFRAILARVAALCNEQEPDSGSPYGDRY